MAVVISFPSQACCRNYCTLTSWSGPGLQVVENRSDACIYACIYTMDFEVTLGVLLVCSSACARVHVLVSVEPPSILDHTAKLISVLTAYIWQIGF